MHQRFLAGDDEAFIDYVRIDADAALDDDWADERRQVWEDTIAHLMLFCYAQC